jgi:uncharacterized membrane protein
MNNQYQEIYQSSPQRARDFRRTARQSLKGFWWTAILVTLIAALLGGASINGGFNFNMGATTAPDYSEPDVEMEEEMEEEMEDEPLFTPEQLEEFEAALDRYDFATMGNVLSDAYPMLGFVVSFFVIIFVVIFVLSLAFQLFVSSPVKVGYQRFFLEVLDGNEDEIRVGTLFRFFKESYGKTIGLNIVHTLLMELTLLPMFVCMIIGGVLLTANIPDLMAGSIDAVFIGVLPFIGLTLLGVLLSLFISIPVSYAYSMAHMIMADYPTVGAIEALRLSRQMMKGNKFRLFCLDLSFIWWYFLGICACGLGIYIVTPYHYTARAAFYQEISGRSTPADVEFPSINPEDYITE